MIFERGVNRVSAVVEKSTHNQRIERLWRDVFEGVSALYYKLFYFVEEEGFVDPLNETHLPALHSCLFASGTGRQIFFCLSMIT